MANRMVYEKSSMPIKCDGKRFSYTSILTSTHTRNIAILIVFSLIEYRLISFMHQNNFQLLADEAQGVVNGIPHWRAYQNRLLGPYAVQMISRLSGLSYIYSFKAAVLLLLLIANFTFYFIFYGLLNSNQHMLLCTPSMLMRYLSQCRIIGFTFGILLISLCSPFFLMDYSSEKE